MHRRVLDRLLYGVAEAVRLSPRASDESLTASARTWRALRRSFSGLAFALVFALPASVLAQPALPTLPTIRDASFDVTAHGVVADGVTDNAPALQKLFDETSAAGGGRIVFPAAEKPYLAGPLKLRSGIELHLPKGATLSPLPYGGDNSPGTYPLPTSGNRYDHFLLADKVSDIAFTGEGTIEGNGHAWWEMFRADKATKKLPARPYLLRIQGTERVLIRGLTISNSPMFHVGFHTTNHVTIEYVTVFCPYGAPNTDGIDPAGENYLIRHCKISVGDDNIAVKAGNTFCRNIVITDCEFGTGHGVSIGGQTNAGLDGMLLQNCTFNGTVSGIRMKADPTQGGPVRNVTYQNITMNNVKYPIVFYSYYNRIGNPGAGKHMPDVAAQWNTTPPNPLDTPTLPNWRNITVRDVVVNGGNNYSVIWGLPTHDGMISELRFINLRYSGRRGFLLYNVDDAVFASAGFKIEKDGPPFTTYNSLVIVRQPPSQRTAKGGTVTFETLAIGGAGNKSVTPAYQWLFEGQPLRDGTQPDGTIVTGATTAKLTLKNIQPAAAGRYQATASAPLDVYDPAAKKLVPGGKTATAHSISAMLAFQ